MHAIRVVRGSSPPPLNGRPLIVCMNHPSWWDPLVALTLARSAFPGRNHYAPIDSAALAKYPLFEWLGFFGIEPDSTRGGATFLRNGRAILSDPGSVLWVTGEGAFTDVRTRPVKLKPGIGRLQRFIKNAAVIPLAVEYTFWEERSPEVLACWGQPLLIGDGGELSPAEWTAAIQSRLESALDRLSHLSQTRQHGAFDVVLSGSAGIGGVYDLWRRVRARLSGRRFAPQHGREDF
jgi:1-acyl-sn-glycerol-3-phosphate acyltransferase